MPMSSPNCSCNRRTKRKAFARLSGCPPSGAGAAARSKSSLSWADTASSAERITAQYASFNPLRSCSSLAEGSAASRKAAVASAPTRAANSGTASTKPKSSGIERKPQSASNSVRAMAISGLWFASLYTSGRSACNFAASSLSGCAWMDKAFWMERTFNMKGSWASSARASPKKLGDFLSVVMRQCGSAPPGIIAFEGPEGWSPIQSSA
mmetsp:Transcript_479/g.1559  ORF Transcript_479/g.1559 Transcript_479/m.1559 type:complete len:209 (+) Transcript_479:637-1263(+)